MKTHHLPLLLLLGASAVMARPVACGCGQGCACGNLPKSTEPLALSATATKALQFQIDEERMAGEIYRRLGEQWQARPFQNIPRAEARHHAALVQLAGRAGMAVEKETVPGRYLTPEVQARYDALMARGGGSLVDALKVGAFVEEQDIADLRAMMATTDNADLKTVAAALEAGSHNHLRAFVRNLKARGVSYEPQVLPAEEFSGIIANDRGHGGRAASLRPGPGRRHGGGRLAGTIATPPA